MTEDCGCGCGGACSTGIPPANRPGLSEIAYRRGTFATFRRTLLDALAGTPELAGLRSRQSSDYAITLLELWSAVADIVTFYNERTANEAFLRTAVARDSVLRLVRLLDYQLAPGLAATASLAFTLEPGASAVIPAGTRVQSIPVQGAKAQKFETLDSVRAQGALNALRLRPLPVPLAGSPIAAGRSEAIAAADPEATAAVSVLRRGDTVILYRPAAVELRTVAEVRSDAELRTVVWDHPIEGSGFLAAHRTGRTQRLFGHAAPTDTTVVLVRDAKDPTSTFAAVASTTFTLTLTGTPTTFVLAGRDTGLSAGSTILVVSEQGATTALPFRVTAVADVVTSLPSFLPAGVTGKAPPVGTGNGTQLTVTALGGTGLSAFDGHDLRGIRVVELIGPPLRFWPFQYPGRVTGATAYVPGRRSGWSRIDAGADLDPALLEPGRRLIATDASGAAVPVIVEETAIVGSEVTFGAAANDPVTVTELGLARPDATPVTVLVSAPVLAAAAGRLSVRIGDQPPALVTLPPAPAGPPQAPALQAALRQARPESPAYAGALVWFLGNALAVSAGVPGTEIAFGPAPGDGDTVRRLGLAPDQVRYVDGVLSAPVAALSGHPVTGAFTVRRTLDPAQTTVTISTTPATTAALAATLAGLLQLSVTPTDDGRLLVVAAPPEHEQWSWLAVRLADGPSLDLDAATARLLGNVAPAGHGESVRDEVLGDADASVPFQRFALRKKQVTPGSLTVRVDGVAWTEVPELYGHGPDEQVYRTRIADDGTTTVQFGDGTMGARPLTGHDNIVATYRQGLGSAGRVPAHGLSILLDRPTGVKKVDNPRPAEGAADPEPADRTRTAAPGTVRTFGRAVSLRDFEDGALTRGEIAKAKAAWVWTGHRRVVHLTVAGEGGLKFSPAELASVAARLDAERDTNRPLALGAYNPVAIRIEARVTVDPRYAAEDVLARVRAAGLREMSFEHRDFAAAVHLSDLYAVMQGNAGVVGVDIDVLDLKSADPAVRKQHGIDDTLPQPSARILVLPAYWSDSRQSVVPAELACLQDPQLDLVLHATEGGRP